MKYLPLSIAAALAVPAAVTAETLDPIIVTANHYAIPETEAPYASEVHTGDAIASSGAVSLYDYLQRYSSVAVMPSFGNPFSQKLDMRGFGIGDGHQNIVVTINGRRLNNIDMVPQLVSAIPVASIERIEITKGSGSVAHGDGATAGAIHIVTRDTSHTNVGIASGSHGILTSSLSTRLHGPHAALSIATDNHHGDGFSKPDAEGRRDEANSNNLHTLLSLYPTDWLELRAGHDRARMDTRYIGSLTLAQFREDPTQSGGNTYTHQRFESDVSTAGVTAAFGSRLTARVDYFQEEKQSEFVTWSSRHDYDYRSGEAALEYRGNGIEVIGGLQRFDGDRSSGNDVTGKDNTGYYLQVQARSGNTVYAIGGRHESVTYTHRPETGAALEGDHTLSAWDLGVNRRVSPALTLFTNINQAFQTPDIDRFFSTDWSTGVKEFNGFIEPAQSRTLNFGLNRAYATGTAKVTLFHAEIENEIYYSPATWENTNIDRSRKSGVEFLATQRLGEALVGTINYAYTRARIVEDAQTGGVYDGNALPGVSDHTATVGALYRPGPNGLFTLHHTYKSSAYAANDFGNEFEQQQAAYHSTDVGYSHKLSSVELFIKVDNLFDRPNGLWIRDDAVYPVNFSRSWRLGLRAAL